MDGYPLISLKTAVMALKKICAIREHIEILLEHNLSGLNNRKGTDIEANNNLLKPIWSDKVISS